MPAVPTPHPQPSSVKSARAAPLGLREPASSHPADFDVPSWRAHCHTLLATWLAEEFTWAGTR
ncbi:hypothetical protein, partial [Nonomuraea sp. NPDC003754]